MSNLFWSLSYFKLRRTKFLEQQIIFTNLISLETFYPVKLEDILQDLTKSPLEKIDFLDLFSHLAYWRRIAADQEIPAEIRHLTYVRQLKAKEWTELLHFLKVHEMMETEDVLRWIHLLSEKRIISTYRDWEHLMTRLIERNTIERSYYVELIEFLSEKDCLDGSGWVHLMQVLPNDDRILFIVLERLIEKNRLKDGEWFRLLDYLYSNGRLDSGSFIKCVYFFSINARMEGEWLHLRNLAKQFRGSYDRFLSIIQETGNDDAMSELLMSQSFIDETSSDTIYHFVNRFAKKNALRDGQWYLIVKYLRNSNKLTPNRFLVFLDFFTSTLRMDNFWTELIRLHQSFFGDFDLILNLFLDRGNAGGLRHLLLFDPFLESMEYEDLDKIIEFLMGKQIIQPNTWLKLMEKWKRRKLLTLDDCDGLFEVLVERNEISKQGWIGLMPDISRNWGADRFYHLLFVLVENKSFKEGQINPMILRLTEFDPNSHRKFVKPPLSLTKILKTVAATHTLSGVQWQNIIQFLEQTHILNAYHGNALLEVLTEDMHLTMDDWNVLISHPFRTDVNIFKPLQILLSNQLRGSQTALFISRLLEQKKISFSQFTRLAHIMIERQSAPASDLDFLRAQLDNAPPSALSKAKSWFSAKLKSKPLHPRLE